MKVVSIKQPAMRLMFIFLCVFGTLNVFGVGGVDTSFSAAVYTSTGNIRDAAVQADGKIVFIGDFTVVNNVPRSKVARLNADGTIDIGFNPPELGGIIRAVAIQPDGKIVIGGSVTVVGSTRKNIVRLNADGSLDTNFADISAQSWSGASSINKIIIQPDNKILFSGGDLSVNSTYDTVRLNANGTIDQSFHHNSSSARNDMALLSDGKIIASGTYTVPRFNSDGSPDNTFPTLTVSSYESVWATEALPDGKFLLGGDFVSINSTPQGHISRILSDGSLDTTFNPGGSGANGTINDVSTTVDGKIYITGFFSQYNGTARSRVARLNADGSLDASLNYTSPTPFTSVSKAISLSDGRVVIIGRDVGGTSVSLVRLNADGSLDTTLQAVVGLAGSVRDIVRLPDGKYIVGGAFNTANGVSRRNITRLNADGSVDPTFNCPLFDNLFATVTRVALQPDGKILFTLLDYPGSIRLNADGTHDSSYVPPPIVQGHDIEVLANGQIFVDGYYKLNPDGSNDTSFSPPNQAATAPLILNAVIQPDGKVVIGGAFGQLRAGSSNIARLNPNGSVDTTFAPSGGANNQVLDLDVQVDGKVVIVGNFTSVNGNTTRKYLARLNADGSLDTSFAPVISSVSGSLSNVTSVKIQPDGKILIGGDLTAVNGIPRNRYARLNANGSLDMSFNIGSGANSTVWRIDLQSDNKVLIAGDFTKVEGFATIGVARLSAATAKTPFDYDGDGRADISVFRPSENKWYILKSSDSAIQQTVFGISGDIPAPSDYDGDGKTDAAIFRPSNGAWWYLSSINNAQVNVNWGQAGDIPRPSDFDGDGKTDFVVYRPSNSVWYRLGSTGVQSSIAFGIAEDKPIVGDFDGDGKSDPAIFRPSTGDWWYASTVLGGQFAVVHWGQSGDIPVPGDYDADGKTDFVVYRPSNGGWYILRSGEQNYTILQFGTAEDKPVAADFDGDGKADVAVWRPSTGTWYLLQTTSGFGAVQWGTLGDVPTENAFLP